MSKKIIVRMPYVEDRVFERDQDVWWLCTPRGFGHESPYSLEEQSKICKFLFVDEAIAKRQVEEMNRLFAHCSLEHVLYKTHEKAGFKYSAILYPMDDGTYTVDAGNRWAYRNHDDAVVDTKDGLFANYYRKHYKLADKLKDHDWTTKFEIEVEER